MLFLNLDRTIRESRFSLQVVFWDISRADSHFLLIDLPLFVESFETDFTTAEKIDPHRSGMERLFMTISWKLDTSEIRGSIEEEIIVRDFSFAFWERRGR